MCVCVCVCVCVSYSGRTANCAVKAYMHDLCVLLSSNDFVPNPNSGKAGPDPKTLRCHQKCKNDKGSTFPQNVCIADKPGTRESFF